MSWLARLKPGASTRTNLLVAALMWSFIGFYLMVRGYLLDPPLPLCPGCFFFWPWDLAR